MIKNIPYLTLKRGVLAQLFLNTDYKQMTVKVQITLSFKNHTLKYI